MSDSLVTLTAPDSPDAELYRTLRGRLLSHGRAQNQLYAVSTPSADVATGLFTANLAVSLAQSGRSVALIEANLRQPTQLMSPFQVSDARGLADSLQEQGDNDIQIHWQPSHVENLYLLSGGTPVVHPADLLLQPRIGYLLEHVRESADIVLLHLPPVSCAETPWLAGKVNGLLLLAQRGVTKRAELKSAQAQLDQAGAAVLGAVFLN